MSDFQLDVDSPYPRPTRQELTVSPHRMPYTQGRITFKHYGKYVERIVEKLAGESDRQAVAPTVDNLARYMRVKSFEYNQEHPNNEVIVKRHPPHVRGCHRDRRIGDQQPPKRL